MKNRKTKYSSKKSEFYRVFFNNAEYKVEKITHKREGEKMSFIDFNIERELSNQERTGIIKIIMRGQ
jgi:hypothetical protein